MSSKRKKFLRYFFEGLCVVGFSMWVGIHLENTGTDPLAAGVIALVITLVFGFVLSDIEINKYKREKKDEQG